MSYSSMNMIVGDCMPDKSTTQISTIDLVLGPRLGATIHSQFVTDYKHDCEWTGSGVERCLGPIVNNLLTSLRQKVLFTCPLALG